MAGRDKDDPIHPARLQRLNGGADGEIGFPRSGWPCGNDHVLLGHGLEQGGLIGILRTHFAHIALIATVLKDGVGQRIPQIAPAHGGRRASTFPRLSRPVLS